MVRREEIIEHITRLLNSEEFSSSPSVARLLTFCVDAKLAGDEEILKETTIGISCFGRSPGYDTKQDPIVRVTARRLRKKLELFYQNEGESHKVQIALPKGGYVPLFERQPDQISAITIPLYSESASLQEFPIQIQLPQSRKSRWVEYSTWSFLFFLLTVSAIVSIARVSAYRTEVMGPLSAESSVQKADKQSLLKHQVPYGLSSFVQSKAAGTLSGKEDQLNMHGIEVADDDAVAFIEPRL